MKTQRAENQLRMRRKKSGLSYRDIGKLFGYGDPGQVSRHERAINSPTLAAALAYEVLFRVPVSTIFGDMHRNVRREIESKLDEFELELGSSNARGPQAELVARKLEWITQRKRS